MTYCQYCGEASGSLPFKCNYCGGTFCGTHRLPENHECSFDANYQYQRAKEKEKEKERAKSRWVRERDLGIKGSRSTIGTYTLYIIIVFMSILGAFYPNYLTITEATFFSYPLPFTWTFFTSIFVIPITNVAELCYFLILIFFAYYFVRAFENRFGPKILLITYLTSAGILVIVHFLSYSVFYYYWFAIMFSVKIGLAPGGVLGLIFVMLVQNSNRSWYFLKVRLRAVTVIIILITTSIVSKVITTMIAFEGIPSDLASIYYSESFSYYLIDIVGPIVALIFAGIYFQVKKSR